MLVSHSSDINNLNQVIDPIQVYREGLQKGMLVSMRVYNELISLIAEYLEQSTIALNLNEKGQTNVLQLINRLFECGEYVQVLGSEYLKKYVFYVFTLSIYKESLNIGDEQIERSIQSALQYPFDMISIDKWYVDLFVKYEDPKILTSQFHKLSGNDTEVLMNILSGRKIRDYKGLPTKLSKKELYVLVNCLDDRFQYENNIVLRAIFMSRVIIKYPHSKDLVYHFFSRITLFNQNLNEFENQIDFWKSAYEFFYENRVGRSEIVNFIDFFENQLRETNGTFNLKGRSYSSIYSSIRQWHERLAEINVSARDNVSWGEKEDAVEVKYKKHEYYFQEIVEAKALQQEGSAMKHCVYTYLKQCVKGTTRIFSMRVKTIKGIYRLLTIEVKRNKVVQVKGKHNRNATIEENVVLVEWKRLMNFS